MKSLIAESIVFNDERIGVLEGILAIEHVVLGEYFIVDKRDEEMIPGGLGFNCSYADPSNVAQDEYPEMAKRLTNETTDENPSESITFKSKSKGKTVHFRIETEARTAASVSLLRIVVCDFINDKIIMYDRNQNIRRSE